ncbi:tryptophan-rich sensory protein, partial [Candidatus Micrarchaeota archaeon]|nr:tryptophan-rich sensory protein [Candidatus Micrarchaeota archaeon]
MDLKEAGKLLIAIIISNLAGAIGSIFTFTSIDSWYATLIKPEFNPPSWIFGPVWTTL